MINITTLLFLEFLKIGIFAIGGGYATIPFLFHLIDKYHWFWPKDLTNMIALSNMTPGPVGINMATYVGFTTDGLKGSLMATLGIITGPFIITLFVIFFMNKYKQSQALKNILEGVKPAACALISVVLIQLVRDNLFIDAKFNPRAVIILVVLFFIFKYTKKFPSLIILAGGILGIISYIFQN